MEKKKAGAVFRLKPNIFKSPFGIDEVSIIRRTYVDDQFCKDKAKELELLARCNGEERKDFRGFAVISAAAIRKAGSEVLDSRSEYVGHAHISHGFIVERHEPPRAEVNERLDTLKRAATFIPDPHPQSWHWDGPPLAEGFRMP